MQSIQPVMQDGLALGRPTARSGQRYEHVIVLGGSLAGLLAARVLSAHAARVTLVERDRPGSSPGPRKGAPQGRHAHLLLQSGIEAIEALLPGIHADLEAVAGPAFDVVRDTLWKIEGRYRPRFESDYRGYALGRPALEAVVRRRVEALSNATFAYGQSAAGLLFESGALRGVRLSDGRSLEGDFVVDASGRGTRVPAWLAEAGYTPPERTRAMLNLTYTSCVVRPRAAGLPGDFRMLLVPPVHPRCPRGGLLLPIEGGRFVATLVAYGEAPPPRDLAGFMEWAARVDDPLYRQVLDACEAEGEPTSFAIPAQEWRRYERVERLPTGLIALGDALCSFDPAFGQGMSVCALEACALDRLLGDPACSPDTLARRYFESAARVIATPWSMGRARAAEDERTRSGSRVKRWMRGYQRALLEAAASSPALHLAFVRVVNLEAGLGSLLSPQVAARVLAQHLMSRSSGIAHRGDALPLASRAERAFAAAPPGARAPR